MSRFRRNLMEYTMKQLSDKLSSISSVGDYLKDDLRTVVPNSQVTGPDATIVGVCIGQNPVNNKYIFVYTQFTNDHYYWEDSGSSTQYSTMYSAASKYDLSSYSSGQTDKIPTVTSNFNTVKYDFGGLENTKTWYSLMSSCGYTINTDSNSLLYKLLLLNGYNSLNEFISNKDSFDGWYLMGSGELKLLSEINDRNDHGVTYYMIKRPNAYGFLNSDIKYWSSTPYDHIDRIWLGYVDYYGTRYFNSAQVRDLNHAVFALQRAAS